MSNARRPNFFLSNSVSNNMARELSTLHQSPHNLIIYKMLTPQVPNHLRQNLEKKTWDIRHYSNIIFIKKKNESEKNKRNKSISLIQRSAQRLSLIPIS